MYLIYSLIHRKSKEEGILGAIAENLDIADDIKCAAM